MLTSGMALVSGPHTRARDLNICWRFHQSQVAPKLPLIIQLAVLQWVFRQATLSLSLPHFSIVHGVAQVT